MPNRILDKPDRLDAQEWEIVKQHPHFTYEILARVPVFRDFAYDASCHHERIDGRGYYRGISGETLSTHARILATADVFDALSAPRPYRDALPLEQVLTIIREATRHAAVPANGGCDVRRRSRRLHTRPAEARTTESQGTEAVRQPLCSVSLWRTWRPASSRPRLYCCVVSWISVTATAACERRGSAPPSTRRATGSTETPDA